MTSGQFSYILINRSALSLSPRGGRCHAKTQAPYLTQLQQVSPANGDQAEPARSDGRAEEARTAPAHPVLSRTQDLLPTPAGAETAEVPDPHGGLLPVATASLDLLHLLSALHPAGGIAAFAGRPGQSGHLRPLRSQVPSELEKPCFQSLGPCHQATRPFFI